MKFSSSKDADRNLSINVMTKEDGKKGYPAFINEIKDGNELPGHRVNIFYNEAGSNKWFTISGPIRKLDDSGQPVLQPRTDKDGKFLSKAGVIVEDQKEAALQFEYLKKEDGNTIFGTLGTININNSKKDGQPSSQTFASLKYYTDSEAKSIADALDDAKSSGDKDSAFQSVRALQKDLGSYVNLFINESSELLALGFEVRLSEKK